LISLEHAYYAYSNIVPLFKYIMHTFSVAFPKG